MQVRICPGTISPGVIFNVPELFLHLLDPILHFKCQFVTVRSDQLYLPLGEPDNSGSKCLCLHAPGI